MGGLCGSLSVDAASGRVGARVHARRGGCAQMGSRPDPVGWLHDGDGDRRALLGAVGLRREGCRGQFVVSMGGRGARRSETEPVRLALGDRGKRTSRARSRNGVVAARPAATRAGAGSAVLRSGSNPGQRRVRPPRTSHGPVRQRECPCGPVDWLGPQCARGSGAAEGTGRFGAPARARAGCRACVWCGPWRQAGTRGDAGRGRLPHYWTYSPGGRERESPRRGRGGGRMGAESASCRTYRHCGAGYGPDRCIRRGHRRAVFGRPCVADGICRCGCRGGGPQVRCIRVRCLRGVRGVVRVAAGGLRRWVPTVGGCRWRTRSVRPAGRSMGRRSVASAPQCSRWAAGAHSDGTGGYGTADRRYVRRGLIGCATCQYPRWPTRIGRATHGASRRDGRSCRSVSRSARARRLERPWRGGH